MHDWNHGYKDQIHEINSVDGPQDSTPVFRTAGQPAIAFARCARNLKSRLQHYDYTNTLTTFGLLNVNSKSTLKLISSFLFNWIELLALSVHILFSTFQCNKILWDTHGVVDKTVYISFEMLIFTREGGNGICFHSLTSFSRLYGLRLLHPDSSRYLLQQALQNTCGIYFRHVNICCTFSSFGPESKLQPWGILLLCTSPVIP